MMSLYSPADVQVRLMEVATGSRIDAIVNAGDGVVVAATRAGSPGRIYRRPSHGAAFELITTLSGAPPIAALASGPDGRVYALTGAGALWVSPEDKGLTWTSLGSVTSGGTLEGGAQQTYGLEVTSSNTVLISNTLSAGGHVLRSTNLGASFADIGAIGTRGLYRIKRTAGGLIMVAWGGAIYKSTNESDGAAWTLKLATGAGATWVAEDMGDGRVLVGDIDGNLLLSVDAGETFSTVANVGASIDDICSMGGGKAIISTYAGEYLSFYTDNFGLSVRSIGRVGVPGVVNNIDRMCHVEDNDNVSILGGTILGQIAVINAA